MESNKLREHILQKRLMTNDYKELDELLQKSLGVWQVWETIR